MSAANPRSVGDREVILPTAVALRTQQLVSGPLSRAIIGLALPAVGSALLQLSFLLADTFWVGRILGPAALAAVSTAGFAVWMLTALGEMFAVGLTAVAARRHGEGNHAAAAIATGSTLGIAVLAGLLVAAAGQALMPALFRLMHTPPEVTAFGMRYLGTYLLGTPLLFGFFAVESSFRASGDTRTPLILLAIAVVLVVGLDPLLIAGAGPLPELGVAGAAVAAVLTRGCVLGVGIVLLARRRLIAFTRFDPGAVLTVMRVGTPTAVTGVFFSAVYMGLTRITTRFGVPALAALGIGHKLEGLSYMVDVGFGLASAALVGQNLGAGQVARARRAGWVTSGYACAVGAAVGAAFLLFPETMVGIFTSDAEVIRDGAWYLRALALAQITMGLEIVLESSMGGAGYTLVPMLITGTFTAARIPLALWLSSSMDLTGVWVTIGGTAVLRGVFMAAAWRAGSWERARV